MKLSLRFLYMLPLLALLLTDQALGEFVFGSEPVRPGELLYIYGLSGASILVVLRYHRWMEPLMRWWFWLVLACVGGMCLESYNEWGVWVKYPHVFSKLNILMPLFGLYAFYRRFPAPPYQQVVVVVFGGLLVSLIVFHREALSLGSFLESERGFSVTSAYLLLPIALLCLNWYLTRGKLLSGLVALVALALIVFLQHRTVWVCTVLALAVNVALLAWRVPEARSLVRRLTMLGGLGIALAAGSGLAVVLENPDVVRKLASSIEDLQNPTTQGTGSFRMRQHETYFPFIEQRPVGGWRLEGFEIPMQLYDEAGAQLWPNFTGHHFHGFYLDRLFYFGILGLLLVVLVPLVKLVRALTRPSPLGPELAALLSFTSTFFVYGASYDWPNYMYGLTGLVLAAVSALKVPAKLAAPGRRRPVPAHFAMPTPVTVSENAVFPTFSSRLRSPLS